MLGLGMTFEHSSPSELLGCQISVDAPAVTASVSIRLAEVINNAVPMSEGVVRVGMAFDGLSDSDPGAATGQSTKKIDSNAAGVRSGGD